MTVLSKKGFKEVQEAIKKACTAEEALRRTEQAKKVLSDLKEKGSVSLNHLKKAVFVSPEKEKLPSERISELRKAYESYPTKTRDSATLQGIIDYLDEVHQKETK
jgi:hypothetical protein